MADDTPRGAVLELSVGGAAVEAAAPRQSAEALWGKRVLDVLASVLLLVVLAPLLALIAAAVLCSGRPVVFAQARVGRDGGVFRCYKFRSMVPDAEAALQSLLQRDAALREEWQRSQKLRRDPRITRIGAFLRKTSLDELPQLWNVLRGDMSLVGPRPIMPHQLERYGRLAPWYLSMRPGITGLWQVTARGDGDFERRVQLDCAYVRQYRFATDLWILLRTVKVVVTGHGAM